MHKLTYQRSTLDRGRNLIYKIALFKKMTKTGEVLGFQKQPSMNDSG